MFDLSLTDQEASMLVEALGDLSRGIKIGANFTFQYNSIERVVQRIETASGKKRAELSQIAWRVQPTPEVTEGLSDIEDELDPPQSHN